MVIILEIEDSLYQYIERLVPIPRSITGNGVRQTLDILSEIVPIVQHEVPSGTEAFDWNIPKEWNVNDAYIITPDGRKIADFHVNPLHLVGYSPPMRQKMSLATLQKHLYSLPQQPSAIPYITSYYEERWGFCLTQQERDHLADGEYEVVIDSNLHDGSMTYGELIVPGETDEEIMFTSYVCHPYMANNELSGPVMNAHIAAYILEQPKRKYTYRFLWLPETVGAILYLSKHLAYLKQKVIAGFVLSCIGDERAFSVVQSRLGNSYADRVVNVVMQFFYSECKFYSFLDRGSDERQFCAPGVDLPFVTLCRSKFGEYPEYHTSLDNLDIISKNGLGQSYDWILRLYRLIENNNKYCVTHFCEPNLGKRGLYDTLSSKGLSAMSRHIRNVLAYCDGNHDVIDISYRVKLSPDKTMQFLEILKQHNLIH